MYRDQGIAPVGRKLKQIRDNVVNPLLVKVASQAMDSSLPLIRPLWMLNPHNEQYLVASDQFLIGDQLMVAPVLEPGVTHRPVYLPSSSDGDNIVWKRDSLSTLLLLWTRSSTFNESHHSDWISCMNHIVVSYGWDKYR